MTKQKLESIFSKSLKKIDKIWYLKLQVNPLAHKISPADFLIITEQKVLLVECKQIDMRKNDKKSFPFSRLTQEDALIEFQYKFKNSYSYVCILLLYNRIPNSEVYLINIKKYLEKKNKINKKSFNIKDIRDFFYKDRLTILKGNILNLDKYI